MKVKLRFSIVSLLILLFGMAVSHNAVAADQKDKKKPNIIFILADDFGYSSLNSYGADKNLVRTPQIDRIAEEGMSDLWNVVYNLLPCRFIMCFHVCTTFKLIQIEIL